MSPSAEDLELIFSGANLLVLPFWALMVLLPNWRVTRWVMGSYIPYAALASLYLYLFVTGLDAESLEAFSDPQLSLADLAAVFSDARVTATGWVHFLVMDLFVGRWIYWQGQNQRIFTRHSLLLCLFAGPIGLLSHLVTQAVTLRFFKPSEDAASDTVTV